MIVKNYDHDHDQDQDHAGKAKDGKEIKRSGTALQATLNNKTRR